MSDIRDYQADHLLLLVGSNPLPDAVAGKLLTAPGGAITLVHSVDSFDLAQRLGEWFRNAGYTDIGLKQVEESNAASVHEQVSRTIGQYERNHAGTNQTHMTRVGLNYTGGTKVMSVHAYCALEQWARRHNREVIFSYLDARTLQMFIERIGSRSPISFYVALTADISIRDLLALHDWELEKDPIAIPVLPESAAALLAIHSSDTDTRIWSEWLYNSLFRNARRPVGIRPPFQVFQAGKELEGQFEVKQSGFDTRWRSKTQLRNLEIFWPNLSTLRETMRNELGQNGVEKLNLTVGTEANRFKNEEDFCKWLSGTWLESALQDCPQELHLKECYMDLKLKAGDTKFQFDVVATRGYQLFAFSCSTEGRDRGLLKLKLFEAYVRTRQMGGDEACVALICCIEQKEADKLQDEMRRDISPESRIRVFGRECLTDLTGHISDWIRQQSKEG